MFRLRMPSPSMAVALIALMVALGGTAAATIHAGSATGETGGKTFAVRTSLSEGQPFSLPVPGLTAIDLKCHSNGDTQVTLDNNTGAQVRASIGAVSAHGAATVGRTVDPRGRIFSAQNADDQEHLLAFWNARYADLTIAWYSHASRCVVLVAGVVL